jgi:magnesium chelatase subunit I
LHLHTFPGYFPREARKARCKNSLYTDLIEWFSLKAVSIMDDATDEEYERILGSIVPLVLVRNTSLN